MTPKEIKDRMRTEPEFTVGALIALYQYQTPEEQSFQTTAIDNGMGFNKVDSKILTDLSKFYLERHYLSDKQIAIAKQKLMKYAGQLCEIDFQPLRIKGKSNNKPPKPKEKLAKKDSNERIRVEFPYDKEVIFAIKEINGYWFDAESKTWTMPLTITNIDKLVGLGFKLTSELQQWYDQIHNATSDISVPGLDDVLRPFQKEAVSYIENREGRALIADEMGLGKEQPLDCGILTPTGWKLMGEIKIGDLVIGSDGKPTKVKGVFPQGIKDAYRVTFSDGSSTKCGIDHLWNVRDVNRRYRKQEFVTKTTKELLSKGLQYPNGGNKWDIPLSKPIDFKPKALYIHPYMMGVLLGDGYLNGTGISVSNPTYDHDIMDRLEKVKPKDCSIHYHYKDENSCPQHSIVGHYNQHNPVLNKLRKLKLDVKSKHRFIPNKYLTSSIKQRIELLRGLMDTDGSCDERSRTVFHSCNKKLAQDVVNLVRSLGGVSYIRDYGGEYQVNVLVNFCPFHTKRKKNNWKKQTKSIGNSHGQRGKFITNIEFVGKEEQQCISVENKDGLYITDNYIVTHNTIEAIAWIQYRGEEVLPALIVCPANLKLNWVKEINKFTDLGKHVEVLEGIKPYAPKKNIMIINYDILQYWENKLKTIRPKTVIADEIHKAKNRKAKRTKSLTNAARAAKFMIGLTGTPILNRPQEIFQPLKIIKPRLFPNFMNFARRYCNPKHNGFAWDYSGASNTIELNQILTKEVMLRRKKEDVLKDLPPKTRAFIPLEIDNRSEYKEAQDDLIAYLRNIDVEKAKRAERAQTLTKINTLKRLAVRGKFKQALDWIEDFIEEEKLIVFTYHQETAQRLIERFEKRAVQIVGGMTDKARQQAENAFQNDENVRLFIGQHTAAGEGLTLTAASNVAFMEYPATPGMLVQCEDRAHRIGQEDNVTVWNLLAQGTIEDRFVKLLEEKAKVSSEVVDGDESDDKGLFNELIDEIANQ